MLTPGVITVAVNTMHLHPETAVYQWQSQKHRRKQPGFHTRNESCQLAGWATVKRGVLEEKPGVAPYCALQAKFHSF